MGSGDLPYGGGGDSSSHAAGGEEVTVNVSRLSGSKLNPFKVNLGWTVDFFKSILVEEFEMPIHEQRLIYRGRILKGDKTFQSYGLKSGHTVHLVRNFAAVVVPANSISTAEAGFNKGRGPELPKPEVATNNPAPNINPLPNPWTSACTGGMQTNLDTESSSTGNVDTPSVSQIMNNQLLNVYYSNPAHFISSTKTIRQLHYFLSSQLGRQTSPEPDQNADGTDDTTDDMRLDMLRDMRLHMLRGRETVDGITAPNNSPRDLSPTTQKSSPVPSEELYATQLSQLREMGFVDTQENIRALIAAAGNVNAAVDRLLRDSAK
ncbi:hypothetical protein ABFS82_08G211200 [Erythranthe guttata]|uniref:ubiquitin domain-containing protein DSK2b-like n=1 Tax=Erythranthe guttata TaxID=4155 RepID=UPI00064E033E|nr:PREDICTED: ubiquitin domain-containing protein DSK2b-like [Erythranthe guttata]|eukprot:XP_012845337.1 PREDICTED: ubiquitin domain-containing protein DSK2b-like [Erythranthe guttata]